MRIRTIRPMRYPKFDLPIGSGGMAGILRSVEGEPSFSVKFDNGQLAEVSATDLVAEVEYFQRGLPFILKRTIESFKKIGEILPKKAGEVYVRKVAGLELALQSLRLVKVWLVLRRGDQTVAIEGVFWSKEVAVAVADGLASLGHVDFEGGKYEYEVTGEVVL